MLFHQGTSIYFRCLDSGRVPLIIIISTIHMIILSVSSLCSDYKHYGHAIALVDFEVYTLNRSPLFSGSMYSRNCRMQTAFEKEQSFWSSCLMFSAVMSYICPRGLALKVGKRAMALLVRNFVIFNIPIPFLVYASTWFKTQANF